MHGGADYTNIMKRNVNMTNTIAWLGSPESRIISIRKFRQYINTLPFEEAVEETRKNWNAGPKINKPHFDISNVNDWPTPWDLFGQSTFCVNSQALGTFYTLILSDHIKQHDIKLAIIEDVILGEKISFIIDNYPTTGLIISSIIEPSDIKSKLGEE
jgi:hypothetical protein